MTAKSVQVRVMEEGVVGKLSLSVLEEQKEYLERIGGGNISEGYRRVMAAHMKALEITQLPDDVAFHTIAMEYYSIFSPFIESKDANGETSD